jgi:WD40 repeat protein
MQSESKSILKLYERQRKAFSGCVEYNWNMQILEGHEGIVHALIFSPDGETLVSSGKDGTVRRWNAWGESSVLFTTQERIQMLAISSDSRYLAIGGSEGSLKVWNLTADEPPVARGNEGAVTGVAFLPDNSSVAHSIGTHSIDSNAAAGSIRFWGWREKLVRQLPADIAPTTAVRFMTMLGPHGLMAWATQNNILTIWPIARPTATRISLKSPCRSLAFSADGKLLAATSDWRVLVFDVESRQERFDLTGHKGIVSQVALSPDGRLMMTGSWDKTVKMWNAANGRELASFAWPVGRVSGAVFAPDGMRAAAAGDEGRIVVWDVDG